MFGITGVATEHRGPGVRWMVTLDNGDKSVWGDLPSAVIARFAWEVWSWTEHQRRTGQG